MNKIILLLLCAICLLSIDVIETVANAANSASRPELNWEISMHPKNEKELEDARWSIILENNIGIYAYNVETFTYTQVENSVPNKNIVGILTRTIFTDKEIIKNLNIKYKASLPKKEKISYCKIFLEFDLINKNYRVREMDVYSNKDTRVDHLEKNSNFVSVPEGSFAEALLEICQGAVAMNMVAIR